MTTPLGFSRTLALVTAMLLAACGGGDAGRQPGPLGDGPGLAPTCSGADVSGLKDVVYVSTQGSGGEACGSQPTAACRTIQNGIDRCSGPGCAVLVRHGLYTPSQPVRLRNGVSLFGSCRWGDDADLGYRTVIQGTSPAPGSPVIAGDASVQLPTTLHGLVVIAKGEDAFGTSSVAMALTGSKGVSLSRTLLAAGNAAAGVDGTSTAAEGGGGGQPAQGTGGAAGGPACPSGGSSSGTGHGGQGGDGLQGSTPICFITCDCKYPNLDSAVGRQGSASGGVLGGPGGARSWGGHYCTEPASGDDFNGKGGQPGNAGACSGGGGAASDKLWGSGSAAGWAPGRGGGGGVGDVGSGGGGGSSGGYCVGFPDGLHPQFIDGVAAGGGGGGGCGGNGGGGGGQGGASIALWLDHSSIAFDPMQVAFVPGMGGDGGSGGGGGVGGAGGSGGNGLAAQTIPVGSSMCPGPSGRGGDGGQGGAGAGGAGGNGGPSIGIALFNGSTAPSPGDAAYLARPGFPGERGDGGTNPNCSGASGAFGVGGVAARIVDLDQPPNDVLASGQTLGHTATTFQQRISANGAYTLIMQTDGNLCLKTWPALGYLWCSGQNNMGFGDAASIEDGNLCVIGGSGGCTNTFGSEVAYLKVTDDGHAVLYDGSEVLWSVP